MDQLADALAGRYTVERELGRGGMATVYLVHDLKHDRPVALKVLRPELGATLGPERFRREIHLAARLQHPHILTVHDSGESDGRLWFTMPYVEGETLRRRLARERQLPLEEAVRIARETAQALQYAHERGVIHRDIKPENLLLSSDGSVLVADFGIARPVGGSQGWNASTVTALTEAGLVVGTAGYMSPDQASSDRELDGRTDIYSLGCVLYEMLAGEPPFTGPTAQAVMVKRFTDAVPSARRIRPAVPAGLDAAIRRAMAKHPEERFSTAAAFAEALAAPAAPVERLPSVAVLPFISLSPNPENEYFADGITEDVIAQLSKIRSLSVISRASVMPFKQRERSLAEVSARLNVGTVLDGSVRRAGDRVRIVAQLIDATTERHLWSDTYDRELTDIFAIQSDVALKIANALQAELSPAERTRIGRKPTQDFRAYQLYLQGRHWYTRYTDEGFRKGIEYYQRAIAADPDFALAHAGLALAYAELATGQGGGALREEDAYREARQAVARALAVDPELGEAHGVLGLLKCVHDFDWAGSEREFQRARELSPGGADVYAHYSWLCGALERYDEAITLVRRAQELDPLTHRADVAGMLTRAGRYDEALESALSCVEFEPEYARGRSTLGWVYINTGKTDEGIAELEAAVHLAPGDTMLLAQLGEAYGLAGRMDAARATRDRIEALAKERYVSPYHLAYVYTGLGEHEKAIDLLEQAYERRAGNIYGVKGSFLFVPLRPHPRFKALLRKMNLE